MEVRVREHDALTGVDLRPLGVGGATVRKDGKLQSVTGVKNR
jgi:hypothetical protein